MVGAFALVVAGVGTAAFSSQSDRDTLRASYQTISASYSGDGNEVQTTRSFDRGQLEKQAKQQAQQKLAAQAQTKQKVEAAAKQIEKNQWVLPVTGYHLTARFGQSSGLWSSVHTGLDFAGPSGSTIVSVAAGTVKSTGYEGAYGNRTIITLEDGTDIWYCHQSRIVVKAGQKVGPGDTIGYTGSTGNVTGPHLHLEVHPNGAGDDTPTGAAAAGGSTRGAVDPEPVLREHNVNP